MKSILFSMILIILPARSQGLYWESTTAIAAMGNDRHSKTFYMPKMFKETAGDASTVIRLDKELIITINDKDKTYSEMTFSELESRMKEAGGKMNEKLAAMKEKLKDMPEEQRQMVEKMMGGMMPGSGDSALVVEKGSKKTISGFACTENVVKRGEDAVCTIWTTKEIAGFDTMGKELKELVRS